MLLSNRRALAAQYALVSAWLDAHGIPYTPATAGFFVWIHLPGVRDTAQETAVWRACLDAGVLIFPGQAFHSPRPGHFRILFSTPALATALPRLAAVFARAGCLPVADAKL
jgi:1-aminocyclopropane-1-carboxylate synthase 1/2/6